MWFILGITALIFLIIFWKLKNPVWGGLTLGVFGGVIVSVISVIMGNTFDFATIWKGAILGTLLGAIVELLGRLADKFRKN